MGKIREELIAQFEFRPVYADEENLRDEFFTDTSLHNPNGKYLMILSLAVLTCVPANVKLYQKMGFEDCGDSDSAWGGEKWHEMKYIL